jgi:uroporphyrinogen-III synthase
MRVLVTRPKDDAEATAAALSARGYVAIVAPLLEIRFRDGPEISLAGVQAVLATSSNGVHALARRTGRRDVPLFAVGTQTAEAARAAGFKDTKSADGDACALAAATLCWAKPEGGVLLHAAGAETKGELGERLASEGFEVHTDILYDAVAVQELPPICRSALEAGALDAVLQFSPRSARIFSDCVVKARLTEKCRGLVAYCISRAAADALAPLILRAIHVAARPSQEALLALLD